MSGRVRREYPDSPIIGVGAIVFDGDRVLLAKRAQDPGKGTWTLPGGAVEIGETLEAAVKREIQEEAAIEMKVCGLVKLVDRIVREGERVRYHYVIADFWGYPVSGRLQAGSDVSDVRYVSLDEVRGLGLHPEVVETIFMASGMRQKASRRGR